MTCSIVDVTDSFCREKKLTYQLAVRGTGFELRPPVQIFKRMYCHLTLKLKFLDWSTVNCNEALLMGKVQFVLSVRPISALPLQGVQEVEAGSGRDL